jgi:acetyl/propionyl-CoA carboxylase alpha subunit
VGLYYDAMLAKLIVWAPTREEALTRMHRALLELTIAGVETSRDFHVRVMEDDEFRAGAIDIQWLERRLPSLLAHRSADGEVAAAVAAALLADEERRSRRPAIGSEVRRRGAPPDPIDEWRLTAWREGLRGT